MSKRQLIDDYQEVTGTDLTNIGLFAQAANDQLIFDGIAGGNYYAGCLVTQLGLSVLNVAPGRAYLAGKVYPQDSDVEFTMTTELPLSLSKIATIVVAGNEIDSALEPRDYIINQATGETESRTGPRQKQRIRTTEIVYGLEAANPTRPDTSNRGVAIADILLTPAGIQTITMLTANQLKSAEKNRQSIIVLEQFAETAGSRIDTLATDMADLAARTRHFSSPHVHRRMLRDIARLNKMNHIDDLAQSYSWDYFLNTSGSGTDHPLWLARVEEGGRFPAAQERLALVRPLNPAEPKLRKTGSFALPDYTDNVRISVVGNDSEMSISQFSHQTVEMIQKTRSRSAVRYGSTYTTCTNASEFATGTYDDRTQTLTRDGETFQVEFTGVDWDPGNVHEGDHLEVRLTETWVDTWSEPYWEAITIKEGLNGSSVGQTFLNANAGWCTFANLLLTRADTSGDITLLLTEVTESNGPAVNKTLARTTVAAADLKTWPQKTRFDFEPVHLEAGRRYALIPITPGNHHVCMVEANKFAEGTFFHGTDGAYYLGDPTRDMAFELGFAKFGNPTLEIDLEPWQLENGITNIKLLLAAIIPNSCDLVPKIEVDNKWYPIHQSQGDNASVLDGTKAMVRSKLVFVGSTDDMPGIDIALSEVTTWRPRTDFRWASKLFDVGAGFTTQTVEAEFRVEAFDALRHTFDVRLLAGETEIEELPDNVTIEVDPYDPMARIYKCTFELAAQTQTYRFVVDATTDTANSTFHIANLFQQAL